MYVSEAQNNAQNHVQEDQPAPAPVYKDDLDKKPSKDKIISQHQLINKLNYINFLDKTILIAFKHKKFGRTLTLKAKPQPCSNEDLICVWIEHSKLHKILEYYTVTKILIPDGRRFLIAEPEITELSDYKICFRLPESCRTAGSRKTRRHKCGEISVYLTQNGALYYGTLEDFCAFSFRVKVKTSPPQTFGWMDPTSTVNVILSDDEKTVYSGECSIIKDTFGQNRREYVLKPVNNSIRRFRQKEFRSTRQQVLPLPSISFNHPLFKKMVHLQALDLSGSGLSVEEESGNAVLLPGLIISNLEIRFGDNSFIKCIAQVVYSNKIGENERGDILKCGLAILDMTVEDHVKLLSLLHQANDKYSYICNKVNLDALWNFFFETGFIYPEKYEFIQKNKEKIKLTYKKLYTETPSIARHFIYQKNGRILGHMAMVRFYEGAWLIHHFAAVRSAYNRGGMVVLNQLGRFINDSHRLYSMKMDFVFCYYRPENKIPNHVFGGVARNIGDKKGCSLDEFSYYHLDKHTIESQMLEKPWYLSTTQPEDLMDLESFYQDRSGGLMIHTLGLEPESSDLGPLSKEYTNSGFRRENIKFSLKKGNQLHAIIMVNMSDIGLNMSDLTNSINVFVVNRNGITKNIINSALSTIYKELSIANAPILLYPAKCADELNIQYERTYILWAFNLKHIDQYFRYLKRLLKFIQH